MTRRRLRTRGPCAGTSTIKGRAAHSSMAPLGVNAIAVAGKLLRELADIEHELKLRPQDPRFDPPYATLQVTRIDGGTATNIVPVSCSMDFDVRAIPGVDIAAIDRRIRTFAANVCLPDMRKVAPEAAIDIAIANQVPPFSAGASSEVVALALNLAGSERNARRLLRHRGRPVPGGRLARRRRRPRRHRAGAHGGRMDRRRPAREVQRVSRAPRRLGRARLSGSLIAAHHIFFIAQPRAAGNFRHVAPAYDRIGLSRKKMEARCEPA